MSFDSQYRIVEKIAVPLSNGGADSIPAASASSGSASSGSAVPALPVDAGRNSLSEYFEVSIIGDGNCAFNAFGAGLIHSVLSDVEIEWPTLPTLDGNGSPKRGETFIDALNISATKPLSTTTPITTDTPLKLQAALLERKKCYDKKTRPEPSASLTEDNHRVTQYVNGQFKTLLTIYPELVGELSTIITRFAQFSLTTKSQELNAWIRTYVKGSKSEEERHKRIAALSIALAPALRAYATSGMEENSDYKRDGYDVELVTNTTNQGVLYNLVNLFKIPAVIVNRGATGNFVQEKEVTGSATNPISRVPISILADHAAKHFNLLIPSTVPKVFGPDSPGLYGLGVPEPDINTTDSAEQRAVKTKEKGILEKDIKARLEVNALTSERITELTKDFCVMLGVTTVPSGFNLMSEQLIAFHALSQSQRNKIKAAVKGLYYDLIQVDEQEAVAPAVGKLYKLKAPLLVIPLNSLNTCLKEANLELDLAQQESLKDSIVGAINNVANEEKALCENIKDAKYFLNEVNTKVSKFKALLTKVEKATQNLNQYYFLSEAKTLLEGLYSLREHYKVVEKVVEKLATSNDNAVKQLGEAQKTAVEGVKKKIDDVIPELKKVVEDIENKCKSQSKSKTFSLKLVAESCATSALDSTVVSLQERLKLPTGGDVLAKAVSTPNVTDIIEGQSKVFCTSTNPKQTGIFSLSHETGNKLNLSLHTLPKEKSAKEDALIEFVSQIWQIRHHQKDSNSPPLEISCNDLQISKEIIVIAEAMGLRVGHDFYNFTAYRPERDNKPWWRRWIVGGGEKASEAEHKKLVKDEFLTKRISELGHFVGSPPKASEEVEASRVVAPRGP